MLIVVMIVLNIVHCQQLSPRRGCLLLMHLNRVIIGIARVGVMKYGYGPTTTDHPNWVFSFAFKLVKTPWCHIWFLNGTTVNRHFAKVVYMRLFRRFYQNWPKYSWLAPQPVVSSMSIG